MSYAKEIQEHLSKYKKEKFPTLKNGYYRGNEYEHILPSICGKLNLLETYRNDFLKSDLSKIKFHQYFHHLNSSQAMCINFFFPLIAEKKLEIILQELELDNEEVNYETVEFEKESTIDNKDGQRATNFDFYFETVSGKKLYFEIKYTENEFGKAKSDKEHLDKYERTYKNATNGKIASEYNNESTFLNNYQIMRNLIHVSDDGYVVFVIPKENEVVYEQAINAEKFVVENYKSKIKVLSWNDLYNVGFEGNLKQHFEEFKKKYQLKQ